AGISGKDPGWQTALVAIRDKQQQARTAINLALGVQIKASMISPVSDPDHNHEQLTGISPGQKFAVKVIFHNGSPHPLKLDALVIDGMVTAQGAAVDERASEPPVAPGKNYEHTFQLQLPETAYTKPGFHRSDPQRDSVYTPDQPQLITLPFAAKFPAVVRVRYHVADIAPSKGAADWTSASIPEVSGPVTVTTADEHGVTGNQ